MGRGRWILPAGALAVVACASIAGLEDGDPPATGSSPTAPSGTSPNGSSGGTSGATSSGSTSGDVPPDGGDPSGEAGPDGPVCGTPGTGCSKPEHCCNNVCREDRRCAGSCKALGEICVTTSDDCCIGAFCASSLGCRKCIEPGEAAERVLAVPNPKSCCSRDISIVGNCK